MSDRAPYGSWPTPVTAELVASSGVRLGDVRLDGETVYWSELRPQEGGRTQLVRLAPGGEPEDLLPEGADARTAVHEYGGGAWWVHDGTVWYADWADQRLRRIDAGGEPVVVSPEPAEGSSVRWADGHVHPHDGRVVLVRETHPAGTTEAVDVVNEVVVLHPDGRVETEVAGPDFVSDPRWSPDGAALAWQEWDHPSMPWDSSLIKVRTADGEVVTVAGGPEEGVGQPHWAPDGSLWFCSDRVDWTSLFRWTPESGVERMVQEDGEVGLPQWTFGGRRFVPLADGRVALALLRDGSDTVHLLGPDGLTRLDLDATSAVSLDADGDTLVMVLAGPSTGTAVVRVPVTASGVGEVERLTRPRDLGIAPTWFSVPEHVEFPGSDGRSTYAHFYPPTNPDARPLEGELPPVIVTLHGGPTSASRPVLTLATQFWTSRGFAVADLDYGGSWGYGREYRTRLNGQWGVVDVADCVAVVEWLADQGRIDPARALIRGGSAGGFTTLAALATSDVFAAGANYFGVADVEALALHTHKFESRYLDTMIAPYPEGREVYTERSPLTHVDGLSSPLITLQGAEDKVVPPAQSESIVAALREKGVPVAYRLYEGEQHGFRRAENIEDSLLCELSFYAQVLGFTLPEEEAVPVLHVENLAHR